MIYLLDKSAVARILTSEVVAKTLYPLYAARVVATCGMVDLELGRSARDHAHHQRILSAQRQLIQLPMEFDIDLRATAVQQKLAAAARYRDVRPSALIIAASAEVHGATVMHYDRDFDRISEVTGQPSLWVVPPGSVS